MQLTSNDKKILKTLEIETVTDLLTYYPYRYEDFTYQKVSDWQVNDQVIFQGLILKTPVAFYSGKLHITRFEMLVEAEIIKITIFNRPWLRKHDLKKPLTIIGKYQGNLQVTASNYNLSPLAEQLGIIPVYHLKEKITAKSFRKLIGKVFQFYQGQIKDLIPQDLQKKYQLLSRETALSFLHFPKDLSQVKAATRTLKYEEFLSFQLQLALRKTLTQTFKEKTARQFNYDEVFRLVNSLGYTLTAGQLTAVNEILSDLKAPYPMHRLLQGDVGSGKTLVALIAMAAMALAKKQSALLVPTEILAIQQYQYLKRLLKPLDFKIACLYSGLNQAKKTEILNQLASGEIDLIVGTHALFQKQVNYFDLGLVIADEQHRFGVSQRAALVNKGVAVDFLLMSATPIPRTLAAVLFGDLEISSIETLPRGRKPIITKLIKENSMNKILDEILERLASDNRCYVVCPAIEASDTMNLRYVNGVYEALVSEINQKRQLPYQIGLLHGKLTSEEKEAVMAAFESGKTQILVTTTVVEVGVNVLAANQMVIYNANRFGLSQLHQLRGRIGRSDKQAHCYLLTPATDEETYQRLEVLVNSNDGFKIAEFDLTIRGPGDVLGVRQSGLPGLILGDFVSDINIVETAKKDAEMILENPGHYQDLINQIKDKLSNISW